MERVKVGLCLLVWNELEGCKIDVPNLPIRRFDEVFAVDGGSTDGTVEYLESRGIRVVKQLKRGYNRAYIAAFEHTSCDALVIYHPKGTIDPETTFSFIEFFNKGADLVVASRIIKGARNEEDDLFLKPRKWFVVALGMLSAVLWWRKSGPVIWDVLHGYRGMRKDAFFAIEPLEDGLSIDLQMVVRSYRLRLKAVEFPVIETRRPHGATHFKALPTGTKLLRYLWCELGRAKPLVEDWQRKEQRLPIAPRK